jgi:hypothetical protein
MANYLVWAKGAFMRWVRPMKTGHCILPSPCDMRAKVYALSQPETCTERSARFMNKPLKTIPKFANETEERAF